MWKSSSGHARTDSPVRTGWPSTSHAMVFPFPPMVGFFSYSSTSKPARCSEAAAPHPAMPPPTTQTRPLLPSPPLPFPSSVPAAAAVCRACCPEIRAMSRRAMEICDEARQLSDLLSSGRVKHLLGDRPGGPKKQTDGSNRQKHPSPTAKRGTE